MAQTPTSETPFRLAFGNEAIIPAKVGLTSYKVTTKGKTTKEYAYI